MKVVATPASRVALLAALVGWTVIALLPPGRPVPLTTTAPPVQFSAGRAMAHVTAIATEPHPRGSAANGRVRDYIRAQLAAVGLQSEVQAGLAEFRAKPGARSVSGYVENVVSRLAGRASTKAVLLVAHYDSVAKSPGAADNASGVAALIEIARVLRASPPLTNDVIFLFTDGEERLLLGATLFAQKHPWAHDSRVVLNFDGGANGGPIYLIRNTAGIGSLVGELRTAIPNAVAASAYPRPLLRRLGMFFDLDPLEDAGLAGMTFGFMDNANFRHRPEDDISRLDRPTLQQLGDYGLAATQRLGDTDLRQRRSRDAVFFSIPLMGVVVYSTEWAAPLACLTGAMLAFATWTGRRRRARGVWLAVPLGIVVIGQVALALTLATASYLLTWPSAAAVISFTALITARSTTVGIGPRLAVMMLAPPASILVLAPLIPIALSVIPSRAILVWLPAVACVSMLLLVTTLPQLTLLLRRTTGQPQTHCSSHISAI